MINMSLIFNNPFLSQPITVKRNTSSIEVIDFERVVTALEEPLIVRGSIQQPTSRDLQYLSDGFKVDNVRVIYTDTPLRIDDKYTQLVADIIEYKGYRWKVITLGDHTDFGINQAMISKQGLIT